MKLFQIATYIGLLFLVFVMVFPLVVTLVGSFMSQVELEFYYFGSDSVRWLRLTPDRFTLVQYQEALLLNTDFTRALLNSFKLAALSTLDMLLIALPAAFAIAFCRFPCKKVVVVLYLFLMLLPYQALEIPHFLSLRSMGLLGMDVAVRITNIFDTMEVVILSALFCTISKDTLEAAALDGANKVKTLVHVVLPQIKHGVITVALLKFINAWNLTEQPLLFLENSTQYPLSVLLSALNEEFWQNSFAFSIVFLLPPLLLYLFFRDDLRETIAMGERKVTS